MTHKDTCTAQSTQLNSMNRCIKVHHWNVIPRLFKQNHLSSHTLFSFFRYSNVHVNRIHFLSVSKVEHFGRHNVWNLKEGKKDEQKIYNNELCSTNFCYRFHRIAQTDKKVISFNIKWMKKIKPKCVKKAHAITQDHLNWKRTRGNANKLRFWTDYGYK